MAGPAPIAPGTYVPKQVGGTNQGAPKEKTKLPIERVNMNKFKFGVSNLGEYKNNTIIDPNGIKKDPNNGEFSYFAGNLGEGIGEILSYITGDYELRYIMKAHNPANPAQVMVLGSVEQFLSQHENKWNYDNFFVGRPSATSMGNELNVCAVNTNEGGIFELSVSDGSVVKTLITPEEIDGQWVEQVAKLEALNRTIYKFDVNSGHATLAAGAHYIVVKYDNSGATGTYVVDQHIVIPSSEQWDWRMMKYTREEEIGWFYHDSDSNRIKNFITDEVVNFQDLSDAGGYLQADAGIFDKAVIWYNNSQYTWKYIENGGLVDVPTDKKQIMAPITDSTFGQRISSSDASKFMFYDEDGKKHVYFVTQYGITYQVLKDGELEFDGYVEHPNRLYDCRITYDAYNKKMVMFSYDLDADSYVSYALLERSIIKNHNGNKSEEIITEHLLALGGDFASMTPSQFKALVPNLPNNTLVPLGLVKSLVDSHGSVVVPDPGNKNTNYFEYNPDKDIYILDNFYNLKNINFANRDDEQPSDGKEITLFIPPKTVVDLSYQGNLRTTLESSYFKHASGGLVNSDYIVLKFKWSYEERHWMELTGKTDAIQRRENDILLENKKNRKYDDSRVLLDSTNFKNYNFISAGPKVFAIMHTSTGGGSMKVSHDNGRTFEACTGPAGFDKNNKQLHLFKKFTYCGGKYYFANNDCNLFESTDGITWVAVDAALQTAFANAVTAAGGTFVTGTQHDLQLIYISETDILNIIYTERSTSPYTTYLVEYNVGNATVDNQYAWTFGEGSNASRNLITFDKFWYWRDNEWKIYGSCYTNEDGNSYYHLKDSWKMGLPLTSGYPRAASSKGGALIYGGSIVYQQGIHRFNLNELNFNGSYGGYNEILPFCKEYYNKGLFHLEDDGTGIAFVYGMYQTGELYGDQKESDSVGDSGWFLARTDDFGKTWYPSNLCSFNTSGLDLYMSTQYKDYGYTILPSGEYLFYDKNKYFIIDKVERPKEAVRKKVLVTTVAATQVDTETGMEADSIVKITKKSDGTEYTPTTVVVTDGNIAITAADDALELIVTMFGVETNS